MTKAECCRLCGAALPKQTVFFQDQYVSNFVQEEEVTTGIKVPIELVVCSSCSLVQQVWSAPQDFLYSQKYWYRSGVTETMSEQLRELVDSCVAEVQLSPDDCFLDIGANDGTMLGFLKGKVKTVGIDPAKNLHESLVDNCDVASNDFWSAQVYEKLQATYGLGKAKIVTAIGMFYDLEDPLTFVSDIAKVLDDNGVFVAQLMTLEPMLEKKDLGNLCHEHLEFYTYSSLRYLFERAGLEIYKITENDTNGGSYRIFSRKLSSGSIEYGQPVGFAEIEAFKRKVDAIGDELKKLLLAITETGKTVHVLGASTKGNCILQYFDIDYRLIQFASERSPEKYDLFTIGTGIRIVNEKVSREKSPDYYLILPWAFSEEMIRREEEHRARGGKFIIPFPALQVV